MQMQNQTWHRLFFPLEASQAVAEVLRSALTGAGYRLYDPFPGGTGLSFGWKRRVRLFVAPARSGWTAALGEPDAAILPAVAASMESALLYARLDETGGALSVWTADGEDDSPAGLARWLRPGKTGADLRRALAGQSPVPVLQDEGPQVLAVPLPPDMQDMAEAVDPDRAEAMMEKLTRSVFGKLGGQGAQADAQAMLGGSSPTALWNSEHGRRLRAALDCLSIPEGWRNPVFADLREAYQVARSRQHNPDGLRLPGDDDALARVPDALGYIAVYAGMR